MTRNEANSATVWLVRGDERQSAIVRWWPEEEKGHDVYQVQLERAESTLRARAMDAFEALVRIREQLEPQGWLVAVQGSRRDAYPSGMARDMGGGQQIYVLHPGEPAHHSDLVDTFAEADPALLATVAEQKHHWEEWLAAPESAE
jgi:hypothetical protein